MTDGEMMFVNVQHWTRDMEKQVQDRVQTVLCNERLLSLMQKFGGGIFRRSSVFHGLEKILADNNIRGKVCYEVGTWNGLTAVILSQFFDRVVTVDIANNKAKYEVIAHLGIKNIECVNISSNEEKRLVVARCKPDFAYLDGNHADDTESDWDLVKHCGRVLFHEVWPFQSPVWGLVHSLAADKITYGGCGLALWRK